MNQIKIVLDTNVFISGIFFSGPPSEILKAWNKNKFQIALSKEILDEYKRVAYELSSKFPGVGILPIIKLIKTNGKFVDTQHVEITVCEDPDDNKFIECAIASDCEIIVSGDKHLLKLVAYEGISVLNPRDFVEKYLR